MSIENIVQTVMTSKKYSNIIPETINRICNEESIKYKKDKDILCTSQQKLDTNFTFFFSKYPTTVQCYASFVSLLVADWIVSGASRLSSLLVHCLCGFGLDNRSSSDIIEARRPSGINLY